LTTLYTVEQKLSLRMGAENRCLCKGNCKVAVQFLTLTVELEPILV